LETGTVTLFKVPRKKNTSSRRAYRYAARAPPVWLTCLSKTSPRSSALLVQRSRHVVPPTSRFIEPRAPVVIRRCDLPQTWAPLRSLTRAPWRLRRRRHAHFHEVSRPLSATHTSRATILGLCLPESRYVLALTTRLDALLPQRTLRCLSNRMRSRGVTLQSLTWQRSPSPLGGASPHAISDRPQ